MQITENLEHKGVAIFAAQIVMQHVKREDFVA